MIIIVNVENLILMFWANISRNTEETVIWKEKTLDRKIAKAISFE